MRKARRGEHAPWNAIDDAADAARFYDRASVLMRALLDELAAAPGVPRPFGEVEDAIGWPRRRIASVLGGAATMRMREFGGRRPYRFLEARHAPSRRWEIWVEPGTASAILAEQREAARAAQPPSGPGRSTSGS